MNILISAYACEPGRGSEGEIGWSLVHELAKRHRVWVITRANNKPAHDKAFAAASKPDSLNFIYYDTPNWLRWYKKGKRLFLIYYYIWQIGSWLTARRFLNTEQIHVAHHLTGGMDWMPSGLALLGLPFVWGPVGSETIPAPILRTLSLKVRLKELLRKFVVSYGRHIDPFVHLTGRKADLILSHTTENLPRRHRDKVLTYVQTGTHPTERFAHRKLSLERGEELTVIYAGELTHWKGASYALDAFLHFAKDRRNVRLVMVGDGPLRAELLKKAFISEGVGQVEFRGKVPMPELLDILTQGDIFLYPSYHHGLATIVLQAMMTGLPVVCLEGDAIGRAVRSDCGITVPFRNDKPFIMGLSEALAQLCTDEKLRLKLAQNAQDTATNRYSYQILAAGYENVYRKILDKK